MISFYPVSMGAGPVSAVADCLEGGHACSARYTGQVEALLGKALGAAHVLLTPSCTAALHMACRLTPVMPGDEVILPSYNFPAAANAVLLCGGVPVLCDVDSATQNLSVCDAEKRITQKTKAVIAVHYAAVACDMEGLARLCADHGLTLIEDAAQAVGAVFRGQSLGTFGRFGCYSFHATKVFSSLEGGALAYGEGEAAAAELYMDNGTDREAFFRGDCKSYAWQGLGESMRMSGLCAAALYPQLVRREETIHKRLAIHRAYDTAFSGAVQKGWLRTMSVPEGCGTNGHIYYVLLSNGEERQRAQSALLQQDIPVMTHYVPLHMSPMGVRLGYAPNDLPQSKKTYETLLRLPIHEGMTEDEAGFVAGKLIKAVGR